MKTSITSLILLLFASWSSGQNLPSLGLHPFLIKDHELVKKDQQKLLFNAPGINFQLNASQEKLDSSHYWEKKFIDPDWTLISRSFYTQNDNGDIISRLELRWKNEQWTINELDSTIYNANDQKIYEIQRHWDGAKWNNSFLTTYNYIDSANQVETVLQSWDDSLWVNWIKIIDNYDGNQNLISEIYQEWDSGDWKLSGHGLYTYDVNNNLVTILGQNYVSGEWQDDNRIVYQYDDQNRVILIQRQRPAGVGLWDYWYQTIYDYETNKVYFTYQEYDNGDWVNVVRDINSTNLNGNPYSYLTQSWLGNEWSNKDSTQFYYSDPTHIQSLPSEKFVSISPNPASNEVYVHFNTDQRGEVEYRIYSLDGRIMEASRLDCTDSKAINICQYVAGTYFLQVKIGDQWRMKVFVKQ